MLSEKHHYYLSTMGIDIWLPRNPVHLAKKTLSPLSFLLRSISKNEIVGKLFLQPWKTEISDEEIFKLLDAMLKAVHLQRVVAENATLMPPIIIVMGEVLAQQLLNSQKNLDELREGNLYHFDSKDLLITYHPLQLLQQPNDKRKAWIDLQKIMITPSSGLWPPSPTRGEG